MDFKKLAQDKLDKISGFKSNTDESEFDDILEGLDLEIENVRKIDENHIELDLDDELDFEPVSKSNDQQIQNLFDGYIGEKNFVPNPYEYGPNATYRNVNEGIVYKKNEQNLWEAFVKDGKSGQQGPRGFAGGGTGVEEVKRIANDLIANALARSSISRTMTLSEILSSSPTSGAKSYPKDQITAEIIYDGSKWDGYFGEFEGLSALNLISTNNIQIGSTARLMYSLNSSLVFWSGLDWLVSDGDVVNVPSTPSNIDMSNTLSRLISATSTNGKRLILNNHTVGSTSIKVYTNADILFNGTISGPTSSNTSFYIQGTNIKLVNPKFKNVMFNFEYVSKDVILQNADIQCLSSTPCIQFLTNNDNAPERIKVSDCILRGGSHGILSYGIIDSDFTNISVTDSRRSFSSYSSTRCNYTNCRSFGKPIVGMLFIPSILSSQHNNGFVNNKIINPLVSGWSEEGLSFDINDGNIWYSKITSDITSAGIQLRIYETSAESFYYKYSLTFQTGSLAGETYDIVSASNGKITLKNFNRYLEAKDGDFVNITVKCRDNIIINPTVISTGDPSGLVFWGFGNETIVQNGYLHNSIVSIANIIENKNFHEMVGLHKITLDNLKFYGKTSAVYDNNGVSNGIDIETYDYQFDYSASATSGDNVILPEQAFMYGMTITNCQFEDAKIENVQKLYINNNTGIIKYNRVKNIYDYSSSTFKNDIIYVNNTSAISGFSGYNGQSLVCTDSRFVRGGVIFDWSSDYNDWILRNGQYLFLNSPTSGWFASSYTATSSDVTSGFYVKIGTIPKNIIRSGITSLQADAIVEAQQISSGAYLSIRYGDAGGNSLQIGSQFPNALSGTRSMRYGGTIGVNCLGTSSIANSVMQLIGQGQSQDPRPCDFTQDINVWIHILTPTSGTTFNIKKSWLKVGVD